MKSALSRVGRLEEWLAPANEEPMLLVVSGGQTTCPFIPD
jgi:hypothetical protein